MRTGESRNTGLSNASADPEVDIEKTPRQRIKARISTSSKLHGIDRVTPPLVTPLVDNGASIGSKSGPREGEPNSGGPSREPRVNFNDQQNRKGTYGSTRGRGSSAGYATGDTETQP